MTKTEILKLHKEKQIELCDKFIAFVKNEGFIETVDKIGNFSIKMPLFYRKLSDNVFLAFNIPTFDNLKKYDFHADFWKIIANSEKDFLDSKIEDKKLIDLRLSFKLERDLDLYKEEISKY
ncbi:hypothetical protein NAT51_16680 [Flavobacterium amniphilum]|uniref:hypothetical protein n=1 Tax=Flavobacterium amniphilum TaxID=1834035 RepID=UPI00202A9520|nr:hypothetical protein [Flavobacterium amniphilum]MCL9807171.1 hypothetical protein [Flavobacterium amniphilum]